MVSEGIIKIQVKIRTLDRKTQTTYLFGHEATFTLFPVWRCYF